MKDQTWDITIVVRVTTMNGWEPEKQDIENWLDCEGSLELVSIESVKEAA